MRQAEITLKYYCKLQLVRKKCQPEVAKFLLYTFHELQDWDVLTETRSVCRVLIIALTNRVNRCKSKQHWTRITSYNDDKTFDWKHTFSRCLPQVSGVVWQIVSAQWQQINEVAV
jgi:hypothetical protein